MALIETTRPYEVLIRFNEDGAIGSQFQEIQEIRKDGELIFASLNPPQPLDIEGQPALSEVMEKASALAFQRVSELENLVLQQAEAQAKALQRVAELENELLEAQKRLSVEVTE